MVETAGGRGCELTGDHIRMQTGSKQSFICIDISDTRNYLLVHEQRLQTTAALAKQLSKLFASDVKRIASKPPGTIAIEPRTIQQRETAEPARVPIAQ